MLCKKNENKIGVIFTARFFFFQRLSKALIYQKMAILHFYLSFLDHSWIVINYDPLEQKKNYQI